MATTRSAAEPVTTTGAVVPEMTPSGSAAGLMRVAAEEATTRFGAEAATTRSAAEAATTTSVAEPATTASAAAQAGTRAKAVPATTTSRAARTDPYVLAEGPGDPAGPSVCLARASDQRGTGSPDYHHDRIAHMGRANAPRTWYTRAWVRSFYGPGAPVEADRSSVSGHGSSSSA